MNQQQSSFNGSPTKKNKYSKEYEHSPQKFSNYEIIHSPKSKGFQPSQFERPSLAQDPMGQYSINEINKMDCKVIEPAHYQNPVDNHQSRHYQSNACSPLVRTPLNILRRNSEELGQNITIERQVFHSDLDSPLCHLRMNSNRNLQNSSSMMLNNSLPSSLAEIDCHRQIVNFEGERRCSDSFHRQRIDNQDNVFERLYKRANRSPLKYPGSVRNSKHETKLMNSEGSIKPSRERKSKKSNQSYKTSNPTSLNQQIYERARSSSPLSIVFQLKNGNSTSSTQETSFNHYQNPEQLLEEEKEQYENSYNSMENFSNFKEISSNSGRKQTKKCKIRNMTCFHFKNDCCLDRQPCRQNYGETKKISSTGQQTPQTNSNAISAKTNSNQAQEKSKKTKAQLAMKVVRIEQEQQELKLKQNVLEQYKMLLRHRILREEENEDREDGEVPYEKQFFQSQNNVSKDQEENEEEENIFSNTCLKKHKQSTIRHAVFHNQHDESSEFGGISQQIGSQHGQQEQFQFSNTKHKKAKNDIIYSQNQNETHKGQGFVKAGRSDGKIEKVNDILTMEKHNQRNKSTSLADNEKKSETEKQQNNSSERIFNSLLHERPQSENQDNHQTKSKSKIKNLLNLAHSKIHETTPSKVKVVPLKYISPNLPNFNNSKQLYLEKNPNSQSSHTVAVTSNGVKQSSQHLNITSRLLTKELSMNNISINDRHKHNDNSPTQRGLHQAREEFLKRCGKIKKKTNTQENSPQEHSETQLKGYEKQKELQNPRGHSEPKVFVTSEESNSQPFNSNQCENQVELSDSLTTSKIYNNSKHQESFQGIFQKSLHQDNNNKQQAHVKQLYTNQSLTVNRRDSFGVVVISEEEFRKRKELQEPDYGYGLKWQHSAEFMQWQERQLQKESAQEECTVDVLDIVHRQQKWLRERQDRLLQMQQENIKKERDLCTFKPNVIGNSPKKQSKQNMSPSKMSQIAGVVATVPLTYTALSQMKNFKKNNLIQMNSYKVT